MILFAYVQSLAHTPIRDAICFICYAHSDEVFAKRLYADLQNQGIRCWLAPHTREPGPNDPARKTIDDAIHLYHPLALVLVFSEASTERTWMHIEAGTGEAKERKEGLSVLFPIRIDEAVIQCPLSWVERIKQNYAIGDFTQWKDEVAYQQALSMLLKALRSEKKLK